MSSIPSKTNGMWKKIWRIAKHNTYFYKHQTLCSKYILFFQLNFSKIKIWREKQKQNKTMKLAIHVKLHRTCFHSSQSLFEKYFFLVRVTTINDESPVFPIFIFIYILLPTSDSVYVIKCAIPYFMAPIRLFSVL